MEQIVSYTPNKQVSIVKKGKKNKYNNILLELIEEHIVSDVYTSIRSQYKTMEYIPSNLITHVMNHHFPSAELMLSHNDNHGIYKIMIKDLLVDSVKNWEYNRPPDMARCPDIARYIYKSRNPVDTMIYLSFTNIKDIFEVLDGIHRLTALNIIKKENSKPLELLFPEDLEFGSNNDADWLFSQRILVNIRFNATQGELIETFKNLNKSQTVPELYIRDVKKEKREIIDIIANEWYMKHKKHFSSSANPHIGNTNRNKFVELLDKLYDTYKIDESSANKLKQILDESNEYISSDIPSKASIDIRVKCKETGCYLFLYKNDKLEKKINKINKIYC